MENKYDLCEHPSSPSRFAHFLSPEAIYLQYRAYPSSLPYLLSAHLPVHRPVRFCLVLLKSVKAYNTNSCCILFSHVSMCTEVLRLSCCFTGIYSPLAKTNSSFPVYFYRCCMLICFQIFRFCLLA